VALDRTTEPWSALLDAGLEDGRLVREAREGPTTARLVPAPPQLHPEVLAALSRMGVESLYSHQEQAIHAATEGPTIVTTGTASGKSMCFNLPTLHILCEQAASARALPVPDEGARAGPGARAGSVRADEAVRPAIYDGDTPREARAQIRKSANVVSPTRTCCTSASCPTTTVGGAVRQPRGGRDRRGARLPRRVRLARRQRAAPAAPDRRAYGTEPRFLLTSATIANPVELAERLTGLEDVRLIDDDGSPAPQRRIAVWNPPLTDEKLGTRRSALGEAAELLARLVARRARTICFMKSRKGVEVLSRLVKATSRAPTRSWPSWSSPTAPATPPSSAARSRRA
jgi:DEAD/DEAH box helicase domain-containing protein